LDANIYVSPLPDIDCRSLLDRAFLSGGFPLHGTSTALNSGSQACLGISNASERTPTAVAQEPTLIPETYPLPSGVHGWMQARTRVPHRGGAGGRRCVRGKHAMFAPDCKLSKHTVLQSRRQPRWEAPACSTVSGGSHAYDRTTQWKRESVGCGNVASHCNMGDGRNAATGRDDPPTGHRSRRDRSKE
jgi:hypothetical protein